MTEMILISVALHVFLFMPEANETSASKEISMSSQLPSKDKHITTKDNPNNNMAFKEHSRTETKENRNENENKLK